MTIRAATKETVIVEGTKQNFEFQNDVGASLVLYNSVEITDSVPTSMSSSLIDSLKNGFVWRYVGNTDITKNTIGLYPVVNNVIQTDFILSVNQSTREVVFNKNLLITNDDGTTSIISGTAITQTDIDNVLLAVKAWFYSTPILPVSTLWNFGFANATFRCKVSGSFATTQASLTHTVEDGTNTTYLKHYPTFGQMTFSTKVGSTNKTDIFSVGSHPNGTFAPMLNLYCGFDAGGTNLTNCSDPFNDQDASTKIYTDTGDAATLDAAEASAASLYLTIDNASSTYLTKADAVADYLTQTSAESTYVNSVSGTLGQITVAGTKAPVLGLAATGVAAARYTNPATIDVDDYGRVIAVTSGSGGGSSNIESFKSLTTTPYTISATDGFISVSPSTSSMLLSLPAAPSSGQKHKVMDGIGNASVNAINIIGSIANPNTLATLATVNAATTPYDIALTPNGIYAYVINQGSNSVTIIKDVNTLTPSVLKTITVGNAPYSVQITPNGNFAYIANANSNNVTVIQNASTANPTVQKTVTVGSLPEKIVITSVGSHAYIANANSNSVSVFYNVSSSAQTAPTITVGSTPFGMAPTPDGNYVYVANMFSGNVSVIKDASSATLAPSLLTTLNVGSNPYSVVVTNDGNYAYVLCYGDNTIHVIKGASSGNPTILTVFSGVFQTSFLTQKMMAFSPDNKYLYITNCGSNTTTVIKNPASDNPSVLTTLNTGTYSNAVAFSTDGKLAYIMNSQYLMSVVQNANTDSPTVFSSLNLQQVMSNPVVTPGGVLMSLIQGGKVMFSSLGVSIKTNFGSSKFIYDGDRSQWLLY